MVEPESGAASKESSDAKVVLLGTNVVQTLFDGNAHEAIGKSNRISRTNFTVYTRFRREEGTAQVSSATVSG